MNLKLQLLPLRYGLVETLDPSSEVVMPYELESRPLGIRLLRDGFLYVIEEETGFLHEYEVSDGALSKLLWQDAEVRSNTRTNNIGPAKLVFPRQSTLHVAYSEVQWTAAKCSQVIGSPADRARFMQQINPGSANPATGGAHLMTWEQAERWLAEAAESKQETEAPELPEGAHPDENLPYLWEPRGLFQETSVDSLKKQVLNEYKDDSLCLIVRDDIGVMRDLANFQNEVVTWIDDWESGGEQPGTNKRDYMLACYIDSLSLMTQQGLDQIAEFSDLPDVQVMFEDLKKLLDPQQEQTRQSLIDWLNVGSNNGRLPRVNDPTLPADLKARIREIDREINPSNALRLGQQKVDAVEDYYFAQCMEGADPTFVETHRQTIIQVKKEHNKRVQSVLSGADFGQRGINDLIDRPSMDAVLERHRANLNRWDRLLESITADRLQMISNNRFHDAAWYYDLHEARQIGLAFSAQYACFKDICRNDNAMEAISGWLEQNPDYDRPLFFTLPLADQITLSTNLATLNDAAYKLITLTPEWVNKLREIERPFLPALDELPESARVLGQSAHDTLTPALAYGFSRSVEQALQATHLEQIPSMEELFDSLPPATVKRMFDISRKEGVTFTVGDADDLAALRQEINDVFAAQAEQARLRKRHTEAKKNSGHQSPAAQQALDEFKEARDLRRTLESRLLGKLTPISKVPDSNVRISPSSVGHPGLTLLLSGSQHEAVTGIWRNLGRGYAQAGPAGMLGDGVGVLIAVLQAANLIHVWRETMEQGEHNREWSDFRSAIASTAASGFMASQSIANTALNARIVALESSLKYYSARNVKLLLGKLHLGLGLVGYGAMLITAVYSVGRHHANLIAALRSGNRAAQYGATTAMVGAAGIAGASGYGLYNSAHAGLAVMRGTSWAVAGLRLSSVFLRVNLVGAIFTVLELGGTWWYNWNNLSRHDAWLQTTPWSRDLDKRDNLPLAEYQNQLQAILSAPVAELRHVSQGNWLSSAIGVYQGVEVGIQLPGLSRESLLKVENNPALVQLSLAGYQVRKEGRREVEHWQPISEDIVMNTEMSNSGPLQLTITSSAFPESTAKLDLVIVVRIEILDQEGSYIPQEHSIRLRTLTEGSYSTSELRAKGEQAPKRVVDPYFLTQQAQ
ncbi:toxin VasX [Pseudomonas neustonica]|uniref:toxin VasX n=1 Tax=Pseudomonas neustonica TaxID=2487346 RepID=UPI003F4657FB